MLPEKISMQSMVMTWVENWFTRGHNACMAERIRRRLPPNQLGSFFLDTQHFRVVVVTARFKSVSFLVWQDEYRGAVVSGSGRHGELYLREKSISPFVSVIVCYHKT